MLAPVCLAQRESTEVEWQKHRAKIEYGVVLVGRHKLDELKSGTIWRMGRNEASMLKTDMALLLPGDQVVVPGSYRAGVYRQGEKEFAFAIEGGSLGQAPQAGPTPVYAKGELAKPEKPNKNLEVTLKSEPKSSSPVQHAKVFVTYGENQLTAPITLVGTKSQKSQGWTFDAFALPDEVVEKHLAENKLVPVGALKKESGDRKNPFHVWNLVVGKDAAELWPAPSGPTDAFSEVKGLDAAASVKATSVKWEDAKDAKPFLDLGKLEVAKGKGAQIVFTAGKQTCTVAIPEPKIP
jgi:hypothetical protein